VLNNLIHSEYYAVFTMRDEFMMIMQSIFAPRALRS